MDFSIPADACEDIERFREFIKAQVKALRQFFQPAGPLP